jgi:SAM-dependent methyltransferase
MPKRGEPVAVFNAEATDYANQGYWRSDEANASKHFHRGNLLIGGVGGGRTYAHLKGRFENIVAVDISPRMVDECHKKGIDARVMDIQHTDFPDESFDNIFLPFHTICYTDSVEDTVREMYRILKPGGVLVFSAINQFFIKDIVRGEMRRERLISSRRKDGHELRARLLTFADANWMRRIFPQVLTFGRVRLQELTHPNWKDRILAAVPAIDKSLYFVCFK